MVNWVATLPMLFSLWKRMSIIQGRQVSHVTTKIMI
jgi:hypothetical protein